MYDTKFSGSPLLWNTVYNGYKTFETKKQCKVNLGLRVMTHQDTESKERVPTSIEILQGQYVRKNEI